MSKLSDEDFAVLDNIFDNATDTYGMDFHLGLRDEFDCFKKVEHTVCVLNGHPVISDVGYVIDYKGADLYMYNRMSLIEPSVYDAAEPFFDLMEPLYVDYEDVEDYFSPRQVDMILSL